MGISVRDVLQLPALRGSTIIAGARGIDNTVEGISLMESNDSIEFIPSGTLILSNARALANYSGPYLLQLGATAFGEARLGYRHKAESLSQGRS